MSTISSFFRLPAKSIAQELHFVERAVCEFTQCIDEQLYRCLWGRNVLEQPVPRFVPVNQALMGGDSAVSSWMARRGDSSLPDAPCPAGCREFAGDRDTFRI